MFLLDWLRKIEKLFLVTLFLAMVALFFLGVVAREMGGEIAAATAWVEEAVRLMNIFLVFCALGLALERGRHVGVDTLRDRLPDRLRWPLLKLIDLVGFLFCLQLMSLGKSMVDFVLQMGQRSPTLDIPMGYIYMAPLIGFSLLALRFALSFFGIIHRFGDHEGRKGVTKEAVL